MARRATMDEIRRPLSQAKVKELLENSPELRQRVLMGIYQDDEARDYFQKKLAVLNVEVQRTMATAERAAAQAGGQAIGEPPAFSASKPLGSVQDRLAGSFKTASGNSGQKWAPWVTLNSPMLPLLSASFDLPGILEDMARLLGVAVEIVSQVVMGVAEVAGKVALGALIGSMYVVGAALTPFLSGALASAIVQVLIRYEDRPNLVAADSVLTSRATPTPYLG